MECKSEYTNLAALIIRIKHINLRARLKPFVLFTITSHDKFANYNNKSLQGLIFSYSLIKCCSIAKNPSWYDVLVYVAYIEHTLFIYTHNHNVAPFGLWDDFHATVNPISKFDVRLEKCISMEFHAINIVCEPLEIDKTKECVCFLVNNEWKWIWYVEIDLNRILCVSVSKNAITQMSQLNIRMTIIVLNDLRIFVGFY